MRLFRIGSALFPLLDGTGAMLHGARWNSAGRRAIYCASSLAAAQLEILVHIGRTRPPVAHVWTEVTVPDDLAVTTFAAADLPPGWDDPTVLDVARAVGDAWFVAGTTALLRVPSVVAPADAVFVVNQDHPDFHRMTATPPRPLIWDPRLFRRG